MKSLLLFDMDGTLIIQEKKPEYKGTKTHYEPYISIKQQMKKIVIKHGVPAEKVAPLDRMALIWNTTRRHLEENNHPLDEIQLIMDDINKPFMAEERADHEISVILPDTLNGLESLKKHGYSMGLVTTASRESYDRISKHRDYGCFGDYFKHSVTRDECRFIKPDPEPINRILDMYPQGDFIYVGDSDHDGYACKEAGGFFILINTREYSEPTIRKLNPDAVINKLTELPELLEDMCYNDS
ncbi:HAD-IA family hydrolase [Candidatus Bathyarchaeota archaeon]|nr:HAD-IA family hydrolase [Candidatus Bathyarchaeota archaeon]